MENLGPYTNFHELNQDWFLQEFNKLIAQWKVMQKNFDNLHDAFNDLKSYIQDYFKNLDVQEEINNKLNDMVLSGELLQIITPTITTITNSWLNTHITNPSNPPLDASFKMESAAAQSFAVGNKCLYSPNSGVAITPDNYTGILPTLASASKNTFYNIIYTPSMTLMNDFPIQDGKQHTAYMVTYGDISAGCFQTCNIDGELYTRGYTNKWGDWIQESTLRNPNKGTAIYPNNYETILPTLASAHSNSYYTMVYTPDMVLMTDFPRRDGNQHVAYLVTYGNIEAGCTQVCNVDGEIYTRNYSNNGWSDWITSTYTIYLNEGDNIVKAINNYSGHNTTFIIKGGHDIIVEATQLYGEDFFNNYNNDSANTFVGLILKNNNKYCFSMSEILCDCSKLNATAKERISCLNSGEYGFELLGGYFHSVGCRYTMHDERYLYGDNYVNVYKNVKMRHERGFYEQCIGGGLGINGNIIIENCIFEHTHTGKFSVSYHNCADPTACSRIVFCNNYLPNSTFRTSWYGTSTEITTATVCGNKMKYPPILEAETSESTVENISIYQWNNDIG